MEKRELLADRDRDSSFEDATTSGEPEEAEERWSSSSSSHRGAAAKTRPLWQTLILLVSIFLLGCTVGVVVSRFFFQTEYKHTTLTHSPGLAHISFKPESSQKPIDPMKDPHLLYSNSVSEEQEQAWIDLLQPVTMAISRQDMELSHEEPDAGTKVLFPDRENYFGVMAVFHDLHCLRRVRRLIYKDIWYPNATAEEIEYERKHADHCLLTAHKTTMCLADVGLHTFHWKKDVKKPVLTSNSDRMCVDWERFMSWAKEIATGLNPEVYRPEGQ